MFAVLALWLTAAQHCNLEAVGLLPAEASHAESASCCENEEPCAQDGCNLVETGRIKTSSTSFKVSAPDLSVCLGFLCLQLSLTASLDTPALPDAAHGHPLDWLPTWQFARRAAPLAQAPSLLG